MRNKWLSSPIVSVVLFALAAALIGYGGINGARALPATTSEWFGAQIELDNIDVALIENGEQVHVDDLKKDDTPLPLLSNLVPDGEDFMVGRTYEEQLAVQNTRNELNTGVDGVDADLIDEWVRVTVYKYWNDADGNKSTELDPAYIELEFDTSNGWTIDRASSTSERTVLYYNSVVPANGDITAPFTKSLTINPTVLDADNLAKYQDATFRIEAVVDAVQTHNGNDARMSAWGQISAN